MASTRLESSIDPENESIDVRSEIVPHKYVAKLSHTGTHIDNVENNCEFIDVALGGVVGRRSRSLSGGHSGRKSKSQLIHGNRNKETSVNHDKNGVAFNFNRIGRQHVHRAPNSLVAHDTIKTCDSARDVTIENKKKPIGELSGNRSKFSLGVGDIRLEHSDVTMRVKDKPSIEPTFDASDTVVANEPNLFKSGTCGLA